MSKSSEACFEEGVRIGTLSTNVHAVVNWTEEAGGMCARMNGSGLFGTSLRRGWLTPNPKQLPQARQGQVEDRSSR